MDHIRILLVDDDEASRFFLERLLQRALPEAEIAVVTSAEAALAALAHSAPDAILSDHWMEGMDGVELLARAKTLAPRAVRVLVTGDADAPPARRALQGGAAEAVFEKPVTREDVASLVALLRAEPRLRRDSS